MIVPAVPGKRRLSGAVQAAERICAQAADLRDQALCRPGCEKGGGVAFAGARRAGNVRFLAVEAQPARNAAGKREAQRGQRDHRGGRGRPDLRAAAGRNADPAGPGRDPDTFGKRCVPQASDRGHLRKKDKQR